MKNTTTPFMITTKAAKTRRGHCVKVKPGLHRGLQVVGSSRAVGYLPRKAPDKALEPWGTCQGKFQRGTDPREKCVAASKREWKRP